MNVAMAHLAGAANDMATLTCSFDVDQARGRGHIRQQLP
jgi:hypothetical protein